MWRIWTLVDPRRIIVVLALFLFVLALVIHFLLLGTSRFNWLTGPTPTAVHAPAAAASPPPVPLLAPAPLAPKATPVVVANCQGAVNASIKGKVVEFAVDKAEIHTESEAMLDRIGDALKGCSGVVVEISGHTDALGAADKNQTLSEDRAKAVETYLIAKGVPAARLIAKGYGSTKPIEAGVSPAANRKNRRIDFTVSAAP